MQGWLCPHGWQKNADSIHKCNRNYICASEIHATVLDSSWNVMARGNAREGKWRGNWQMEWVASTLHTTSEHGASSITTADAHTSAASSRMNWHPRWFKWTRPFGRKTISGFCACAITFQLASTISVCTHYVNYVITPRTVATKLLTFQVNLWGKQYSQLPWLCWQFIQQFKNVYKSRNNHFFNYTTLLLDLKHYCTSVEL